MSCPQCLVSLYVELSVPVTFNLFRVRKFPARPEKEKELVFQTGDPELHGTPAQTVVIFKGHNEKVGFESYISKHEMLKKVQGRLYDGTEFSEFFKKNEVMLILKRDSDLLLCKSSGTVA